MPTEVTDVTFFTKLAEKAETCRVVRQGDQVKVKLSTRRRLYTIKMGATEADSILKNLKCKIVELSKEKKPKPQRDASTPHEKQGEE
ncbi:hypothetical protein MUP59_08425 [Candidatus Bathyarchaeota archaeon]|nr:hypothetical protein [Candidatus Bathyarchaeota archaeon]